MSDTVTRTGARVIPLHADDSGSRTRWRLNGTGPTTRRSERPALLPEEPVAEVEPAEETPSAWEEQLASTLEFLRRRIEGDYAVDDFGFDVDLTDNVLLPMLRPLYRRWFRVETIGMHHVPDVGAALVVANHSGTVPLDSLMTAVALHDDHPAQRHMRMLGADLMFRLPGVGALARKGGSTLACMPDAERLMRSGELVGVWPEGFKGVGKPFRDRYKLQRFGRGGFVSAALRNRVPIIPCSIVGAEEIYPKIGDIRPLARLLGAPYFPVTPDVPAARPARGDPAPVEVVHRVRRADPHRHDRPRRGRRPHDGLQHHRPGPRDHPAHPLPPARPAPQHVPGLNSARDAQPASCPLSVRRVARIGTVELPGSVPRAVPERPTHRADRGNSPYQGGQLAVPIGASGSGGRVGWGQRLR